MSQIVHQVFSHSRKKQKQQRLAGQKQHKLDRQEKRERTRGSALRDDIQLADVLRQFGINFFDYTKRANGREEAFALVPQIMQGKRPESLEQRALDFLVDEFDAEVITDPNGRTILNFPKDKPKGEDMNLFSEVAEKSGHQRKVVKEVYEAMLSRIRVNLKNERAIRLPDLCRIRVAYKKAVEKHRGTNPFTGEKNFLFKARPAANRLKISPLKRLKDYVAAKVEIVEPKKKKKHKKKD